VARVRIERLNAPLEAATYTLMGTDRKVDDLFRQHTRILQTSSRWLEPPEKVQHQKCINHATTPDEASLHPTQYEPLTCVSNLRRPPCLQMVKRRSLMPIPMQGDRRVALPRMKSRNPQVADPIG
jgi:hypothetical protein